MDDSVTEKSETFYEDEFSDDDNSNGCLKIVIDSPQSKRKCKLQELDLLEKEIIESVGNDIEEKLEEKAAKANLTVYNVKNIIKHVVSNEHVLAMVRQAECPDITSLPVFEPKLTRAKAKELFSTPIPWISPTKSSSKVQVLISEELQEDSSGDEYLPGEDESEDDRDGSVYSESDPASVEPPTPKNIDSSTQTNWTEDGVFKLPPVKTKEGADEATIARRTRSKLSLSSTPLEVIEEAFIPPDITTDMYDMDCDDDEWKDFLKKFTRPLDEVIKPAEDEDHDPEYNVLVDEEMDKVDKEELRADKAVKVTRKELNELIAELFEYADNFSAQNQTHDIDPQPQYTVLETLDQSEKTVELQTDISKEGIDAFILDCHQQSLLKQQMRQHVQMLTQNFILTYEHPEYADMALKYKEYLFNLKYLPGERENSYFTASNLHSAVKLVESWENKIQMNDEEARNTKNYVAKVIHEYKQCKAAGIDYLLPFPPLVLDTISKSDVFLYPSLLPRVPFKPSNGALQRTFVNSENELIALGLEQFMSFLQDDANHVTSNGRVPLKHVCHYIQRYMIPTKDFMKLYKHVCNCKNPNSEYTPIKYYFENKKAPATLHYVIELDQLGIVPPCKRKSEELPHHWKQYIYPNQQATSTLVAIPVLLSSITKVPKPPVYNKSFVSKRRRITPKLNNRSTLSDVSTPRRRLKTNVESVKIESSFNHFVASSRFASTPKCAPIKLEHHFKSPVLLKDQLNITELNNLKFNSTIFNKLHVSKQTLESTNMLPSMPSLSTPVKKSPERNNSSEPDIASNCKTNKYSNNSVDWTQASSTSVDLEVEEALAISSNVDIADDNLKDNLDDINALMVASSTITTTGRKRLSNAQKKKAKLKKEAIANISMLSPEDPNVTEEKTNLFVQAFYDKLQERLDIHDYHRLIEILNGFDEGKDSVPDLYKKVNEILSPKYPELTDEFLTFLTSSQAKAVGKLVPHLMLSNMSLFLRKLEMYFKEQPSQVRKIYRSLTELTACVDITMERVKGTILPLLKGNNLLTDWFLQIFPCEKPPNSMLNGPWETIEIGKETSITKTDDVYETIVVPEVEDPYGGPNCICSCHNVTDQAFKNKSRHCIPCGTKFLQGRVYVQTGKGLRLAKISFNNSLNIDHFTRLGCRPSVQHKRHSEISPAKQVVSPSKDSQDEIRMSNESEDETECAKKKQQKLAKTPRKRKPKQKDKREKPTKAKKDVGKITTQVEVPDNVPETVEITEIPESSEPEKISEQPQPAPGSDSSLNEQKPTVEEPMEWDCNTSIESMELKLSPEPSAESESEETSQDNINSDSDGSLEDLRSPANSSHSENSNSNTFEEVSWTKDEDKIILETFQREGNKEETFSRISELLENRSVQKIKSRFHTLMNLLQKMAAANS